MTRLETLFHQQKQILDHFFQSLNPQEMEEALALFTSCKGTIAFSGLGKSGLIAQKIVATLISTGTRAHFLSPSDALHGDIGIIGPEDLFVALSKSGESQELLDLIPYIQEKKAKTLAVVSQKESRLAKACDKKVCLPLLKELCPYDLAPTLSTTLQLLFGDAMAIALMQAKGFSAADFGANHPAGFLGKKSTLKIFDLMRTGEAIPLCRSHQKLLDVLSELSGKRCGALLVVDERGDLEGIFTDGDLRRAIEAQGGQALEMTLESLMTKTPRAVTADRLAFDVLKLMEQDPGKRIAMLPVLDKKKVIGIVHLHDILEAGLR